MTTNIIRPTIGQPQFVPAIEPDEDDWDGAPLEREPASAHWDLSFGSTLVFSEDGGLYVNLGLSDDAIANHGVRRSVTREQVLAHADHLRRLVMGEPYFETFEWDSETEGSPCGHVCNICGREVNSGPCPEHAPDNVPGLTKLACTATPAHDIWIIAGDYYDPPCWRCLYEETIPKPEPCAHWGWRRWTVTRRALMLLRRLHLVLGYAYVSGGPDHRGCMVSIKSGISWRRLLDPWRGGE